MQEYSHYYALTPEWYIELAKTMGVELIENKLMVLPETLGTGHVFFTEVIPDGLSVFFLDAVLSSPVQASRVPSNNDLYIIYFDLSEEVNLIQVEDIFHNIGYTINLGLAIVSDNHKENSYKYSVGERQFIVRLIVHKNMLGELIDPKHKNSNKKNKLNKKKLFFYDHIDSNSKVLMHSLKSESALKESFDYHLKGVALKLLANFIERYSNPATLPHYISDSDVEILNTTKDYLINNLYHPFPGITFLATMAGMSATRYKTLFKHLYLKSPHKFYARERMMLAKKLMESGGFISVAKVIEEMSYSKHSYFTSQYYKHFGRKPAADFKFLDDDY